MFPDLDLRALCGLAFAVMAILCAHAVLDPAAVEAWPVLTVAAPVGMVAGLAAHCILERAVMRLPTR